MVLVGGGWMRQTRARRSLVVRRLNAAAASPGSMLIHCTRMCGERPAALCLRVRSRGESSREQLLDLRAREPIVAQRFDVHSPSFDLVAFGLKQLKHANRHRVVGELRLIHDALAAGQEYFAKITRSLTRD